MDQAPDNDQQLAEASRSRVSQFSGNVLFFRCTPEQLEQLKQFGGTLKVDRTGSTICRGSWIFASKKEAQFALTSINGGDDRGIHVQEYSPVADDACFTRLRVAGIPASATIADVAKLTPKADHITIRTATDSLSAEDGGKAAVVSFNSKDDCIETFQNSESAKIQGVPVCIFFERKKGDGTGKKRKQTANGNTKNRVVGFGAKGKGRGPRNKKETTE